MSVSDTIASEALSASLGGAFSSAVLYPLEVLKTRMQADDNDKGDDDNDKEKSGIVSGSSNDYIQNKNSLGYARYLYRREGMEVFFE